MRLAKCAGAAAVVCILCILIAPPAARAYLDPGTGSYLFQVLIAGLVGGLFMVKIFWARIKAFFAKLFGKGGDKKQAED